MKRLFGILLALLLVAPVSAQSPQIRQLLLKPLPAAAAVGGGLTITPIVAPAIQVAASPSYTVNLGAGSAGRIIVVCVGTNNTGATSITDIKLNGVSMTPAVQATPGSGRFSAMFYLVDATSNASTPIVVTGSASIGTSGMAVYAITGALSAIPNSVASDTYNYAADPQVASPALTISAGGGAIEFGHSENATITPNWTTGVAGASDLLSSGSGMMVAGNHITATGTITPSLTGPLGQGWGMVAASWQ